MAKAEIKNGTKIFVEKGTKTADVLEIVADVLQKSKDNGKGYFSKTVVVREKGTGKVFLGKAFSTHIGIFTQSMKIDLTTTVTRGTPKKG